MNASNPIEQFTKWYLLSHVKAAYKELPKIKSCNMLGMTPLVAG